MDSDGAVEFLPHRFPLRKIAVHAVLEIDAVVRDPEMRQFMDQDVFQRLVVQKDELQIDGNDTGPPAAGAPSCLHAADAPAGGVLADNGFALRNQCFHALPQNRFSIRRKFGNGERMIGFRPLHLAVQPRRL